MQHTFDYRDTPFLKAILDGVSKQPVRCLICEQQVNDLTTQCSGPAKRDRSIIHPSRNLAYNTLPNGSNIHAA